jgi:hypothetical protein
MAGPSLTGWQPRYRNGFPRRALSQVRCTPTAWADASSLCAAWDMRGMERSGRLSARASPRVEEAGGPQRSWSVKPSAKPTLVRTQHLPLPAKIARELGFPGLADCCF